MKVRNRIPSVDDHALVREGIAAVINGQLDVEVVTQTSTGHKVEPKRIRESENGKIHYLHNRLSSSIDVLRLSIIFLIMASLGCTSQSRQSSHEPATLTFLDVQWEASDRLSGLAQDLQDFTRETGIQVKRLPAPDASLSQLALWKELLQRGAATPDVYGIDVIWSGMLSRYLLNLKPYFGAEISSQSPVVVASYTVGDKLVAVPSHAYVGVLLYRTDLLRRYGYLNPPRTWDELGAMAARIQAGERAKGKKDFWGYVWQGGIDEDLTCSGLEWQASEGGGRIIEDDLTISVNNPETIRAWQRAARWVGSISPPGVIAYAKWDAENAWSSGKAAFFRGWESDYSLIKWHVPPAHTTLYGVTSLPSGRTGRADTLGGNGLAVSQNSAHPREAVELIRFLLRRDLQLMRATEHSDVPKEFELRELPVILNPYPRFPDLRQHGGEVVARPSIVAGTKYEDVTRAYIRAVHSVLTGEKTASESATALEKELVEITGFRKGPPPKRN
jgi:trehalose/maltose transport system substrate-binding protein